MNISVESRADNMLVLKDDDNEPGCKITFQRDRRNGATTIANEFRAEDIVAVNDEIEREFNLTMDGFDSLLLAMYSAGIDLSTPKMLEAIGTALDAIHNNAL